jgi:hypothetical protein
MVESTFKYKVEKPGCQARFSMEECSERGRMAQVRGGVAADKEKKKIKNNKGKGNDNDDRTRAAGGEGQ